ncbi:MAG: carbohydrate ABC transporter permease [Caldilineaceae bacterium]|uniref:Carbohydrate ABC transporter permease n=1 Tax=Caldilineaceae bacterium SB0675_bin_29 TaxID=2605266 RepID=A0A6B1FWC3_9CHLR|nr:carbohydrate ABC transporter permease [Caldilineaceae bacterium]MDE0197959.1 carbohydrate ABC transporter permease [Caldilineaceae bacterium]MYH60238.1 carbohydrate ABC transporter permease [Caldilineaceae bacterium SB0675_bin_29]
MLTKADSAAHEVDWTVLLTRFIFLITLLTISVLFILPFFWMLMTSLKAPVELMKWPPGWFPDTFRWQNYEDAVTYIPFFRYVGNTMAITLGSILGVLISCPMVAYGFSHIDWPGRDFLFVVMLMTIMIPFPVTMIPLYVLFARIGWINTYLPLVLPLFFGVPFYIFLLRQFFMTIPGELTDAARIDGASEPRIYWQLILPLTKPALATVVLFQFLSSWSDFLGPLLYLRDSDMFTIAVGLQMFHSEHDTEFHLLMAASTILTVPIIVIFYLVQRTFIQGITLTGLQGT